MLSNNYRSICSLHDDEAPAEYEYSSMILLTFDVDSYLISRNFGDCALEMPTPGVGPCYPPGDPTLWQGWGGGIEHSKPQGTGDFFENSHGFWGNVHWYDVWQ